MRILIADEEPLEALTVAEILTLCGHQVLGPTFGSDEARRVSRQQQPSLAFIAVDFDSPEPGIALGRQLSEELSTAVILTTSDVHAVTSCTWALGVLRKPYDPDDVAAAVAVAEAVLSGSSPSLRHMPPALELFENGTRVSTRTPDARPDRACSRVAPILLVEERAKDAQLAIESLRQNAVDNEVVVVRDGTEALACLEECRIPEPALILIDLNTRTGDGLEVVRRVKTQARWRCIPVVVFSASNDESIVRTCYEHGVNACVIKPADAPRFAKSLALVGRFWTRTNTYPKESRQHL